MHMTLSFFPRAPDRSRARDLGSGLVAGLLTLTLLAGCGGGGGSGSSGSVAPVVTTAPVAVSVTAGQTATFNVVASGTAPLTYQWQSGGTNIAGATGASYTTPATTTQMSGQTYDVVVGNAAGQQVTSVSVALTVTAPTSTACASAPAAPGGLVASGQTATSVVVTWAAVSAPANCSIAGYNVYASTTSGFTPSAGNLLIAGVATPDYTSSSLAASTTYFYVVEALDTQGASAASTQLAATTLAAAGTGTGSAPTISSAPTSQSVTIGTTATFSVTAGGTGPFAYQWRKNGTAIAGATAASYNTPSTTAGDDGAKFSVVVSNAAGSAPASTDAVLGVNSFPSYTAVPGFIVTDLNNNTHGAWADNQIYVEILGLDPVTGARAWVSADGTVTAASLADNTAPNALKGPDGHTYPNYAFTLAQSHQLKLPPLNSGRIYISLGAPMYIPIQPGTPLGFGGANGLNATDPNNSTHYDWYEFAWGNQPGDAIFINTTQVDEFGLPMTLDVWGNNRTFHQQTGITESIAQIDQEFAAETPAIFQMPSADVPPVQAVTALRIWAPAHVSFAADGPNAHYMDAYVNSVWTQYGNTPLTLFLNNNANEYAGQTTATGIVFTEIDQHNGAYAGAQTYTVAKPTTQDLLLCAGSMAFAADSLTGQEVSVTKALEAQICAAFDRHVMETYANWAIPADYYQSAPADYYAKFWHAHSIGNVAYGFAFDDVDNQSSSIVGVKPEHMAFGISY